MKQIQRHELIELGKKMLPRREGEGYWHESVYFQAGYDEYIRQLVEKHKCGLGRYTDVMDDTVVFVFGSGDFSLMRRFAKSLFIEAKDPYMMLCGFIEDCFEEFSRGRKNQQEKGEQ